MPFCSTYVGSKHEKLADGQLLCHRDHTEGRAVHGDVALSRHTQPFICQAPLQPRTVQAIVLRRLRHEGRHNRELVWVRTTHGGGSVVRHQVAEGFAAERLEQTHTRTRVSQSTHTHTNMNMNTTETHTHKKTRYVRAHNEWQRPGTVTPAAGFARGVTAGLPLSVSPTHEDAQARAFARTCARTHARAHWCMHALAPKTLGLRQG